MGNHVDKKVSVFGPTETAVGTFTSWMAAEGLLKFYPQVKRYCGFGTPLQIASTAVVFSCVISTGVGAAVLTHWLRSPGDYRRGGPSGA